MCVRGVFVAMELKKDDKAKADPLQAHILKEITKAGGIALVVHPGNWKSVQRFLSELIEEN